jgi:hypothetical protein
MFIFFARYKKLKNQLAAQAVQLKEQDAALAAFRTTIPQLTFRSRIDITGTNCLWKHEVVNKNKNKNKNTNTNTNTTTNEKEGAVAQCVVVPMAVPFNSSHSVQKEGKDVHPIPTAYPME